MSSKDFFKTVWSYILAFTVNLKKTAQAVNEAKDADELDEKINKRTR